MALKWGARRQVLYYGVGTVIFVALLVASWQLFFKHAPTCFDKIENGNESGVDCGGSCALLCPDTAKPATILWSRSFLTAPGIYTAAAYIQNNNVAVGAGARQVHYSFQLLDDKNILVAERDGVVDIPPVQTVPIVESNIDTGERQVATTFFTFTDDTIPWSKVSANAIQKLRIAQAGAYQDGKLSATVANDSYDPAQKVAVLAVLFDSSGVARAASKATLSGVAAHSSQSITFTWPEAPQNIIRAEVTVLPSF